MAIVLVVDDSSVDRRLAGGILEKNSTLRILYASDGQQAMDEIERHRPDLVVTDLQMPEINGLELVEAVRARYPLVPVILMTAHGSEEIAVQALERGAASYVPKSKLASDLLDTVENVLAIARADRRHERLLEHLEHSHFLFSLPNDLALVPPLVDFLQELVGRMRLCDETGRIRVGIALEEALLNAIYHGNLELTTDELREASSNLLESEGESIIDRRRRSAPFSERKVRIEASISPQEAAFVIRDEGPGFDPASVPDPTDPANIERESGRGLILMRTFMNELKYNETGNEVTLVKRRDPPANQ